MNKFEQSEAIGRNRERAMTGVGGGGARPQAVLKRCRHASRHRIQSENRMNYFFVDPIAYSKML